MNSILSTLNINFDLNCGCGKIVSGGWSKLYAKKSYRIMVFFTNFDAIARNFSIVCVS